MEHINKTLGPALLEKASGKSFFLLAPTTPCLGGANGSSLQYLYFFLLHMPWLFRNLTSALPSSNLLF